MNEIHAAAKRLALTGLILMLVASGLSMLVRIFPEPVLAIYHLESVNRLMLLNPLTYLSSIIAFGIYILLYFLLKNDLDGKSHIAGTLLTLVLIYIGAMPLITLLLSMVTRTAISVMTSAAEVGSYSMVETVINCISIIGALSRPLLAVAAALHWADSKQRGA